MSDATGKQIQIRTDTKLNRYPAVFKAALKSASASLQVRKILSFGCSTGEEPLTLATEYFKDSEVFGVDININAIKEAKKKTKSLDNIEVFHGDFGEIAKRGPYQAIFAMSVLCRWPESAKMSNLSTIFPFQSFADTARQLDQHLDEGGMLIVQNSNYDFLQTEVSKKFDVVLSRTIKSAGFVKRFEPSGQESTASFTGCIYRKRKSTESKGPELIIYDEQLNQLGRIPRVGFA